MKIAGDVLQNKIMEKQINNSDETIKICSH